MDYWVNNYFPVDIDLTDLTPLSTIRSLRWSDSDKMPREMTVENTGYSLNVSAKYSERRPSLNGSTLRCPYEFWCFHFHCGTKHDNGRVHTIMGKRFPMEIHLMFYNVSYTDIDDAISAEDGILTLVYMCQLVPDENLILNDLISKSLETNTSGKLVKINPFPLSSLFDNDVKEYFMHWSLDDDRNLEKKSLWIISPKPVSVNDTQLSRMRSLKGLDDKYVVSNCRSPTSSRRYRVFSVGRPEFAVMSLWRQTDANEVALPVQGTAGVAPKTAVLGVKNDQQTIPADARGRDTTTGGRRAKPAASEGRNGQLLQPLQTSKVRRGTDTADETEGNTVNVTESTKDIVIRSIDNLLTDLIVDTKKELVRNVSPNRLEVHKTHREGVRMTNTALRREMHIKNLQNILKQRTGKKK